MCLSCNTHTSITNNNLNVVCILSVFLSFRSFFFVHRAFFQTYEITPSVFSFIGGKGRFFYCSFCAHFFDNCPQRGEFLVSQNVTRKKGVLCLCVFIVVSFLCSSAVVAPFSLPFFFFCFFFRFFFVAPTSTFPRRFSFAKNPPIFPQY